jgi:CDP-paratose 2-epimerase
MPKNDCITFRREKMRLMGLKKILVTGSSGLIGSEVCTWFAQRGWQVHGIDNNQRAVFFGPGGDTRWNQQRLQQILPHFRHHELDIRHRAGVLQILNEIRPDAIVHAAAQPSHDKAAQIPFDDFETNALGTLHLLEAARQYAPEAPFVHMSTNKVYGDLPNRLLLKELDTRFDFAEEQFSHGISEQLSIDQSMHSLFGASKLAADVMVQEYGRYFGMPTCCLRGGCLTGPHHSGVELHGFLSYLVKCNVEHRPYTIFGYKGKQVRDNIHSADVAAFMEAFIANPRSGEVYNIGGGKQNTCSILEAFALVEKYSGQPMQFTYQDTHRAGDHICYYSDLRKIKEHYPQWDLRISLDECIQQMVAMATSGKH